ncbi:MAG: ribosome-binding factor A [Patescibacteria group bacterium]
MEVAKVYKRGRYASRVRELVADFFLEEGIAAPGVLLSIKHVELPKRGVVIKVMVSVFPTKVTEEIEKTLHSLENKAALFLGDRIVMRRRPIVRFIMDHGEEHRERINELLRSDS